MIHFLPNRDRIFLSGDFDEVYNAIYKERGKRKADLWYCSQLVQSLPKILFNSFYWSLVMFKNYLKVTLRNLKKHKGYSLINVAGLSVGMACFVLILLFVQYEFSYESQHELADRIYRVNVEQHRPDSVFRAQTSPVPLAETLHAEIPDIVAYTRFQSFGNTMVSFEDRRFYETGLVFVDSGVLDIFNFLLVAGNKDAVLKERNTVMITEAMAVKYFGREDPVGKTLTLNNQLPVTVTGVFKDHPDNTNIRPDFLLSFETLRGIAPDSYFSNWISQQLQTYILLPENHSVADMEDKIESVFSPHKSSDDVRVLKLEQLKRMHLFSEVTTTGDIKTIYIFLAVGLLIILTACINFMNLATARSAGRAKEVGLRKVVGAIRRQLIKQFMGETLIFTFISVLLALILVYAFLPVLNSMTGQAVAVSDLGRSGILLGLLGIVILVGLLSGSYPSLFLSGFQPAAVLKGTTSSGTRGAGFRKILVIGQFSISIILIACTLILGKQLHFLHNKDLGFKKDQIVVLRNNSQELLSDLQPFKEALLQNPKITGVSGSNQLPSSIGMYNNVTWEGAQDEEEIELVFNEIDYDFLDTYEIELVQGRNFDRKFPGDDRLAYRAQGFDNAGSLILNEEAARRMNFDDPIGKRVIQVFGERRYSYTAIGVIKDFHFTSLRNLIQPMNFFLRSGGFRYISIKLQTQDVSGTLGYIEETWNRVAPGFPFESFFLDTVFEERYRSEERLQSLFSYFSLLAIFIACLGLFGLASFAAEQRTKEIGIRKVLGASSSSVVLLLSKEFTWLVLIANVIALPLAYLIMSSWLHGYAYRINVNSHLLFFFLASAAALGIAWLTVGFQAVKAAMFNPVDSLRYE